MTEHDYFIEESIISQENSTVTYKIILPEPTELETIRAIGESLRDSHPDYKNVLVSYNLQDDPNYGLGYYAISNFNRGSENNVRILGISKSDFELVKNQEVKGNIIGDWINATAPIPRIAFSKSGDQFYSIWVLKDGVLEPSPMEKVEDRYYYLNPENKNFYIIDESNNLLAHTDKGALLLKYKPL